MSLFNELKRRNVFRVGIAYVVIAWLMAQVAELLLDTFESPDWILKSLLVLFLVGFPFALFFAWAFELTPEGIKLEKEVDRSQSITHQTGRKLDFAIMGIMAVALAYFSYDKFVVQKPAVEPAAATLSEAAPDAADSGTPSIAVLPFVNMSDDASNEYFSDGISEEILNVLAKVRELKVAGRTSSFAFKGKTEDLRGIGEKLNVKTLLEGSVRKDDARQKVRVTVQLINVEDGYHIWSESYDRSLEDIFAIQEEIAREVATALKIELLGAEEQIADIARPDLNAYDLYLQGRSSLAEYTFASLPRAIDEFEQAMKLDPDYVPAQLGLAETYILMNETGAMEQEAALSSAEELLRNIIAFDPNNSSALAMLGGILTTGTRTDYAQSEALLQRALEQNPRNVLALKEYSALLFQTGRSGSLELAQKAAVLDPYSAAVQLGLCRHYMARLELDMALDTCAKVREIEPNNPSGFYGAGQVYQRVSGQMDQYIYWFAQAMPLDPDDPEIPAVIARTWLDLDDLQQAQVWLDKAIAIDAEQPAVIGARIRMLQALEQTREARTLARDSLEAGLGTRQLSDVTMLYLLVNEALQAGDIEQALSTLERLWPEAFSGTSVEELIDNEFTALHRAALLLRQNPVPAEAHQILTNVSQIIDRWDFDSDPNFDRLASAMVATLQGNSDQALELLLETFENGGLRREWRLFFKESFLWSNLQDHPGFRQLLSMLEDEAETQRENAYKLLALLE
jgi:TolB-like protein/cytochrome c-type biogenesis protein CcmH/NrfG